MQNYNLKLKINKKYKQQQLAAGGASERKLREADFRNDRKSLAATMFHERQNLPPIATREAYGDALVELGKIYPNLVVLDGETSNSTYSEKFREAFPDRYLEMFIAEQNMASVGLGLSKMGFIPFMSAFAAFWTRAFDQIRMAQYSGKLENSFWKVENGNRKKKLDNRNKSNFYSLTSIANFQSPATNFHSPNLKFVGSHAGVSIGQDGPSQMALEDLAMFRSILESVVFYPGDAVSTVKLTHLMAKKPGLFYLRTTRGKTTEIYEKGEQFQIGGSKIHQLKVKSAKLKVLIIAAGITLHEALKAQQQLANENVETVVMDCYSVKPIDVATVKYLTKTIKNIIVVEDHYPSGGLGETVSTAISNNQFPISKFIHLAVKKTPRSGSPEELLSYEEIDAEAIVKAVKSI